MEPTDTLCLNCEKGNLFVDVETGDLLCKMCRHQLTIIPEEVKKNLSCKYCKSKLFADGETGDLLCKKCGYVSPVRAIEEEASLSEDEKSMHAPKKRFGKSTVIRGKMDADGNPTEKHFRQMKSRLTGIGLWDDQICKSPEDKKMIKYYHQFNELINILIPVQQEKLEDVPWDIYYKCLKKNLQQGRSAKPIMIAAICVFSLQHKNPYFDFSKYAKLTRVDKKKILEAYVLIRTKLDDVKVEYVSNTEKEKEVIIDLIRNDLNSFPGPKITLHARKIISEVTKSALTGGFTPKNQAAAAVFLACQKANFPITIPNIAKYADTSPSTMKNVCEKFNSKLNINF